MAKAQLRAARPTNGGLQGWDPTGRHAAALHPTHPPHQVHRLHKCRLLRRALFWRHRLGALQPLPQELGAWRLLRRCGRGGLRAQALQVRHQLSNAVAAECSAAAYNGDAPTLEGRDRHAAGCKGAGGVAAGKVRRWREVAAAGEARQCLRPLVSQLIDALLQTLAPPAAPARAEADAS